jgi:hypothetical protein
MKLYVIAMYMIIILALIAGCKDDNLSEATIKGVWTEEEILEDYNRISKVEYNFKTDNTVEILRIELNVDSRAVLGYRHRTIGNYVVSGNKLSFSNLVSYNNDDTIAPYSPLEDLVKTSEGDAYEVTFAISDSNKLTLTYPPCGPLENCIETKTLIMQD